MLKKDLLLLCVRCCIIWSAQYVNAVSIEWAGVWRDNIVYEPGSFTGVMNQDRMSASAELSSVAVSDDYKVLFTATPSGGPVSSSVYLSSYRQLSPTSYEYVNPPLPAPGSTWEGYTYNFQVVDASTLLPFAVPPASWTINSTGYLVSPLAVPGTVSISGSLVHPTISWDPVLWWNPLLLAETPVDCYRLRFYELNPDGSFDYATIGFKSGILIDNIFTLDPTIATLEAGKSYAIGIQSRVLNPAGGGTLNRSQYYIRYDVAPTPIPEPTTALLLGSGLIGLVWYGRKRKNAKDSAGRILSM